MTSAAVIDQVPSLAIAMTTALRRVPTLPHAIKSLRAAGFSEILHLFTEPGAPLQDLDNQTIVHANPFQQGCFGNWRSAIQYLATTTADWFLIVQDDAIWSPGSAKILRDAMQIRQDLREGFLSAFVMDKDVPRGAIDGWNEFRAGWNFWGALAICMKRDAADQLMQHSRFVYHRARQQVDAVVAASMLDLNRPSFVHVPSLVDHIGTTSTIGHDAVVDRIRGYRFGEI